jgi:hypothetical protein
LSRRGHIQSCRNVRAIDRSPVLLLQKQLQLETKEAKSELRRRTLQVLGCAIQVLSGQSVFASSQQGRDAMLQLRPSPKPGGLSWSELPQPRLDAGLRRHRQVLAKLGE